MASDSPAKAKNTADEARRLALSLDAIEAQLNDLELGSDPDVVAKALRQPIEALDAAAREALS